MNIERLTKYFYELGSLRKIARSHRQMLMTDDLSDNIASHSFRVIHIGYILAKMEWVDPYKVMLMCMFHDVGESRTGDLNWTQKKYLKVDEEKLLHDQLDGLVHDNEALDIMKEYEKKESKEAIVAKDADKIEQCLLLMEYVAQWVHVQKFRLKSEETVVNWMVTDSAKKLGRQLYNTDPHQWWNTIQ